MRPYGPDSPWRLAPGLAFLNHGSFGACPVPVLEAQAALRDRIEANPVRFLARELDERLAAARDAIASFLNADPGGLAFVTNATAGVATVLRSIAPTLAPGAEILTTDHEYNAVLVAAGAVAARAGGRLVVAPLGLPIRDADQVVERVLAEVTPRTRLAVISHVTSPTGLVLPIERLVRELDARGVDTLVDAAHAPGMVPVDVGALGAAYWTGNGHKWCCGPRAAAVLHVREDRRALVEPLAWSHGFGDAREDRPLVWRRFDWTGTLDPTPILCLAEAVMFMATLHADGWPGLMAENRAKAMAGRRRLLSALGAEPLAPEAMLGALAAVELPGLPTTDEAAEALRAALFDLDRVEVPVHGWPVPGARRSPTDAPARMLLRISAQRYVDTDDIERLAEALPRRIPAVASAPPGPTPKHSAMQGSAPQGPTPKGSAPQGSPGTSAATERLTVLQGGRRKAYRPLAAEERGAAYRAGLAAYRAGEFFEAHELWEPAWMGTDDLPEREFLQGLIKVAAAHVHRERGNAVGMARNLEGARSRLVAALDGGADSRGLGLRGLVAAIDDRLAALEADPKPRVATVRAIDLR